MTNVGSVLGSAIGRVATLLLVPVLVGAVVLVPLAEAATKTGFNTITKLVPSTQVANGQYGFATSVSSNGSTILVGAPNSQGGADGAYVFMRRGSNWLQSLLVPNVQLSGAEFGIAVALSGDGNTALIGGYGANGQVGEAYVFVRSGSTWTQQGPALVPSDESGAGEFGRSVSLSYDGNTALIGANQDNGFTGAAWVFTRSGTSWTQLGSKLTVSGELGAGDVGFSVAISANGSTALVGGNNDNSQVGAAWVFTLTPSGWIQQGGKLTASGEVGSGQFGYSVALSPDGNTALIGAPVDNNFVGAAFVFTRSGTTWTQQGPKLTASDESLEGLFGTSVAASTYGTILLIGGNNDGYASCCNGAGAAWEFVHSGSTWVQSGSKLIGPGMSSSARFGAVSLSSLGTEAAIGAYADNGNLGSAWVFSRK